jgi:hypothetical protein
MHRAYKKGFISSGATNDILTGADPVNAHKDVKDDVRLYRRKPLRKIYHRERAGHMGIKTSAPSTFLASPFAFIEQAAQLRRTCSALKPSGAPYCVRCCPCNSLCDFLCGAQKWLLVAGIVY